MTFKKELLREADESVHMACRKCAYFADIERHEKHILLCSNVRMYSDVSDELETVTTSQVCDYWEKRNDI